MIAVFLNSCVPLLISPSVCSVNLVPLSGPPSVSSSVSGKSRRYGMAMLSSKSEKNRALKTIQRRERLGGGISSFSSSS